MRIVLSVLRPLAAAFASGPLREQAGVIATRCGLGAIVVAHWKEQGRIASLRAMPTLRNSVVMSLVAPLAAFVAALTPSVAPLYAADRVTDPMCDVVVSLETGSIQFQHASDCGYSSVASAAENRVFGFCVQPGPDIDGDGYGDVAVCSPPSSGAASGGNLALFSPETGAAIWQTGGPTGMRSAYLCHLIDDQDLDGHLDIVVACYDVNMVPYTWLVSGKSGETLVVVKQDLFTAEALVSEGKVLYSPSDIDGSKLVDAGDVLEYQTKLQSGTAPDIIKDGVADVYDLNKVLEDFFAGTELVGDKPIDLPIPANLAMLVLHPEGVEPWCHHVMLSGIPLAASGGSISTVCTPEAVILLIIQALEAQGYAVAQIVLILAGMGFSAALIAQVYGTTVEAIEAILAQTTHWAYCRGLYGSYKAACALAGACKGPPSAANCNLYRANFLANATCAILRSKHMTECIPQSLRSVWDPEGGHGTSIVERWNAAAKCALLFATAGCGALPPLTPPNIPGLGPMTITPGEIAACTTGAVRYSVANGTCGSYGAERYTDIPETPIDWNFVNQQLGITQP